MNISVPELSKRFLKALDSNYNVVDEKSVYEIISTLENTRVTRELLEATRLAKHINELRRKTKDQVLARRSKSLLKRWREMLLPAVPNAAAAPTTTTNTTPATPNRVAGQQSVPPSPNVSRGQNGALNSTPRGPGRPPKQPPPVSGQQSSLSLHNNSNSASNNSNNVHKLAAFSQHHNQQYGKHKENHVNNNSLRVPNASTSMLGIRPINQAPHSETEIINLTDDRSNSPSMFQQYQQRLQQQQYRVSPSKKVSSRTVQPNNLMTHMSNDRLDYLSSTSTSGMPHIVASSANNHLQSSSASLPGNIRSSSVMNNQQQPLNNFNNSSSGLTSCDNNLDYENSNNVSGTNVMSSRKHKKHKKEKRVPELLVTPSKTNSLGVGGYNHNNAMLIDDHSAPNFQRDRSDDSFVNYMRTGMSNSLILPDNDSLSNTSASIFNNVMPLSTTTTTTTTPTGTLSFAGHFSKASTDDNTLPAVPHKLMNNRPDSRSVSPSSFHVSPAHSNHSLAIDPDVIIVNHDSPDTPATLTQSQPVQPTGVKTPKKRGRKKGSKGIDSLLATQNEGAMQTLFNADSFSDLKQKITSISGHKKVKTTKEILSDIQNKRSASGSTVTSPSVTQAPSPESAMSEISHHSQASTRAATPEPSTSTGIPHLPTITEEPTEKPIIATTTISKSTLQEDVELTIKRLLAQLPPIHHNKTDDDNESESDIEMSDNEPKEFVPKCTCTLREVKEEDESETKENNPEAARSSDNPVNIEINIIKDSDEEMADAERAERLKLRAGRKRRREKVVKSIFDLDDDNEDAEVGEMSDSGDDLESVPETTDTKDVIAVLAAGESLSQHASNNETGANNPTQASLVLEGNEETPPEMPQFTKYEAVINPDCPALQFYETDRNEVTNYHIRALHNRFVPNVNGNWNQRDVPENEVKREKDVEGGDDANLGVSIETANRVVPRYNFLVCDKIPKQFPDFQFDYRAFRKKCKERTRLARIEAKVRRRQRISDQADTEESEKMENGMETTIKLEENSSSDIEMNSPTTETKPFTIESSSEDEEMESDNDETELPDSNNHKLPSFNTLITENETGVKSDTNLEFSEWYQSVQAVSSGEDLIILPYVVID